MNKLNKHIFLLEAFTAFLEREELRVLSTYMSELDKIYTLLEERFVDVASFREDQMAEGLKEEQE